MSQSIGLTFSDTVSIFIPDSLFSFSVTITNSTYSTTSHTVLSNTCTNYATPDAAVSTYGTTYASIMSSSFKLYSYSLVMTLILKNLSTSICFISERTTKCFVGDLSLYKTCVNMYKFFLHITTSGKNPLKIIPMDLEFPIIPMLKIFLKILYCLPSSVLPCSVLEF